jgi:hypothetical protein
MTRVADAPKSTQMRWPFLVVLLYVFIMIALLALAIYGGALADMFAVFGSAAFTFQFIWFGVIWEMKRSREEKTVA